MKLPVEETLVYAQLNLENEKKSILKRKMQLFGQFKAFALNKLRTTGQPFEVKFRDINGHSNIGYRDLNMGDDFVLKYGSFIFNPKTGMITDYVRTEIRETKTCDDFEELINNSKNKIRVFRKAQQTLKITSDLEKKEIGRQLQKKVKKILIGIFNGKLSFRDPEFKRLVSENIILEQELQSLNDRVAALNIINSSSGVNMEEVARSAKQAEIMQFLHELDGDEKTNGDYTQKQEEKTK